MNLINNFPRSPREKLVGLVHIPRMLDKVNAKRAQLLGEYIFPCPMDKIMLKFLGLSDQEFAEKTFEQKEVEIAKWISEIIISKKATDIDRINRQILHPKRVWWKEIFLLIFNLLNPNKKNFNSWVDKVDYEEGRI